MKKIISAFVILLLLIPINGQIKESKNHSLQDLNCKACHLCTAPTKQSPCLIPCPRENQTAKENPVVVSLDKIENIYLPVTFSHRIHSQMSQMAGGCASCHHYNTVGSIQKCETCHEVEIKRDDINKPSLKRAYHMQCMECHREWSHETECNSCHTSKKDFKSGKQKNLQKKYAEKNHPVVLEPTKLVYETKSDKGKLVTFYHDDHTKKFGLTCATCHKQESCTKCHDVNRNSEVKLKTVSIKKTFEEQHKNCISCHKEDNCSSCHSSTKLESFDHAKKTGWVLSKHHIIVACSKCHGSKLPYKKLDNKCSSCHQGWNKETFKHTVTGLQLDETHSDLGCEDCHSENNYAEKPSCTNCHENYVYPKQKPGKLVRK